MGRKPNDDDPDQDRDEKGSAPAGPMMDPNHEDMPGKPPCEHVPPKK